MPAGDGTGRVVYIDRRVYTTGPSRTVVTNRRRVGLVTYVYRTIYVHRAVPTYGGGVGPGSSQGTGTNSGISGGGSSFSGGGGGGGGGGLSPQQRRRRLRRSQRQFLQQKAARLARDARRDLRREMARRRAQLALRSYDRAENARLRSRTAPSPTASSLSSRARLNDRNAGVREVSNKELVLEQLRREREYAGRRAYALGELLGRKPGAIKRFSLDNLVDLLFDPHVGNFDPENRSHVSLVQRFLNSHGKNVAVDGVYSSATHTALVQSFRQARLAEERKQRREVTEAFYSSGILKEGEEPPYWWPFAGDYDGGWGGLTPSRGELLRLLQRGGFSGAVLWGALTRQMKNPYTQFLAFREEQILRLAQTITHPALRSVDSIFPASSRENLMRVLRSIYSPTLLSQERFGSSEMSDALRGRVHLRALLEARTFDEFEGKVERFAEWEERQYLAEQKRRAAESVPWWGKALHWYDKVGDAFRTRVMADVMFLTQDTRNFFLHYDRDIEEWEDRANAEIADSPTAIRWAFEIVVDPLTLIPIGAVAGVAGRGTIKGLSVGSRAALRASLGPGLAGTNFGVALARAGRALETAGAQKLWLPKLRDEAVSSIATGGLGLAPAAAYRTYHLATRLKTQAVGAARQSVEASMRHGFKPVSSKLAKYGLAVPREFTPDDAVLRELGDMTETEIRQSFPTVLGQTISDLHSARASLWIRADRPEHGYSSVGASILQRWRARWYVMETHRLAKFHADDVRDRIFSEVPGATVDDQGRWVLPATPEAEAARTRAMEEAHAEYERIKNAVGIFRRGVGDQEVSLAVQRRVDDLMDKLENVIFPELQSYLEELAEQAGFDLWDEFGEWVAKEGLAQGVIRAVVAESFDPANLVRVANPMFRKPLPFLKAKQLMEAELKRRQGNVYAFFRREVERGNPRRYTEDWLQGKYDDIAEEVNSAWRPVRVDGKQMYEDTREFIEESALYVGHLEQSLAIRYADSIDNPATYLDRLMNIGLPARQARGSAFDREMGRIAWALGSKHGDAPFGITEYDPTAALGLARFPVAKRDRQLAKALTAFHDAVTRRQVLLAEVYKRSFPKALVSERAFWQALSHAQSRPLKAVYYGLRAHLALWQFVTLPLNPGWRIRNVFDNTAKSLVEGTRDPRAYFVGGAKPGSRITSVFDHNLRAMRFVARQLDAAAGTNVEAGLVSLMDSVWMHSSETLGKIFSTHGIEVPEHILSKQRFVKSAYDGPDNLRLLSSDVNELQMRALFGDEQSQMFVGLAKKHRRLTPEQLEFEAANRRAIVKFKDFVWDFMGSRPEDRARRVIYRDTFAKVRERELKAGANELLADERAFIEAVDTVEKVLFDYSKISTLEDNLRILFPFIQFWRKNSGFWLKSSVSKPWLPVMIGRFEQYRQDAHSDWPAWMRRYFQVKEASDVTARVPGLEWLVKATGMNDVMYDPLNFFSFAPLYRMFKSENYNLPGEKQGWAFIAPLVDAMTDVGLGINPLIRKPLENAGIVSERAWRAVFPHTPMVQAISRKFIGDWFADRIIDLDSMFADPILGTITAAREMFGSGSDTLPSERFEELVEQWVQTEMVNQVARGEKPDREAAVRKIQDYFLLNGVVGLFTSVWVRRMTTEDFYLSKLQEDVIEGTRDFADLSSREKELLKLWRLRKADRVVFEEYLDLLPMIRTYYRLPDYRAKEAFKLDHPELLPHVEPAWKGNLFPLSFVQQAHLVADTELAFRLSDLANTLELDFETRQLAERYLVTPELEAFWRQNDSGPERWEMFLRGQYFRYLRHLSDTFHAIPERDFDAKESFLNEHPELREFWNANNTVSDDYELILQETLADLRDRYFEFADVGDWNSANAFLDRFPFLFDRIQNGRYIRDRETGRGGTGGTRSQHARDYLKAKRWLDLFFSLPEGEREAWLKSDAEGAAIVRWYFGKYAEPSSSFDDFGSFFGGLDASDEWLRSMNPELFLRLKFWKRYWSLPLKDRPLYVLRQAEEHGVFIYGMLGQRERHDREQEWLRKAYALGFSVRAAHYLYVKPLLDLFFTLKKKDRALFLRANPEVQEYLDEFSRKSVSGDPKLDRLIERYFKLPTDSQARSLFLSDHPEVQAYFNEQSSPAERALRRLLEVYFDLQTSLDREKFLVKHPEIQDYFEQRRAERDREDTQLEAFDNADPRLAPFFSSTRLDVGDRAEMMQRLLAQQRVGRKVGLALGLRRERIVQ